VSGPMVSFHFQRLSMVSPSRLFPPGNRRNFYPVSIHTQALTQSATYRSQIAQSLHQITSHSIRSVIPCRWEQTDQVEVKGATRCLLEAVSTVVLSSTHEQGLTEASNVSENVLLVLAAVVFGVRVNSCWTHSPATLLDDTLVLARVFPLVIE
jgi:hypothetical protein